MRGWGTRIPSGRLSLTFFHGWLTRRTQPHPCDIEIFALHSLELLCEELRELTLQLLFVLHNQFNLVNHLPSSLAALTIQLSYHLLSLFLALTLQDVDDGVKLPILIPLIVQLGLKLVDLISEALDDRLDVQLLLDCSCRGCPCYLH